MLLSDPARPLLWDLDGTIVDTRRDIAAGVNALLDRAGLPALSLESVTRKVGKGVGNLVARSLEEAGRPARDDADLAASIDIFRVEYGRHLLDTTRPYDRLDEILRALRARGRRMAVVSNKPEDLSRRILEHLDLAGCFCAILGGDSRPTRKPDPEPLFFALSLCAPDAMPSQAALVGDSLIDAEAARAAGMPFCAVAWGYDPEKQLAETHHDWWAETPERLHALLLG